MPSPRKRIGFLPRSEVQVIINRICKDNKLSQSKVTGILVEEALVSRGVLNSYRDDNIFNNYINNINNSVINSEVEKSDNKYNLNDSFLEKEVQMIKDYIEFKFFKNIMTKNNKKV